MIEAAMVSTTEVFNDNITMSYEQYILFKNPSMRKSLCQFSEILEIKRKTDLRRLCAAK